MLVEDLPAAATCAGQVTAVARASFITLFDSAPLISRHFQTMIALQLARDLQDCKRSLRTLLRG